MSVFTGPTLQDLLWVAAGDDECGAASRAHFDAVEGTVYHIAVSSWSEETGDVVLAWDRSLGPPQWPYPDEYPSIRAGRISLSRIEAERYSAPTSRPGTTGNDDGSTAACSEVTASRSTLTRRARSMVTLR